MTKIYQYLTPSSDPLITIKKVLTVKKDKESLELKKKLDPLNLGNCIAPLFGEKKPSSSVTASQPIYETLTEEHLLETFTQWLKKQMALALPADAEDIQFVFIIKIEELDASRLKQNLRYWIYSEFLDKPSQRNINFLMGWIQEEVSKPIPAEHESYLQFLTRHAPSYLNIFALMAASEMEIREASWLVANQKTTEDRHPSIPLLRLFDAIVTFESTNQGSQADHDVTMTYFKKIVSHLSIPHNFSEALEQPPFNPNASYLNYLTDPSKYNRGSFLLLNRILITNPAQLENIEISAWFRGTALNYPFHHLLKTEVGVRFLSNMLMCRPEYTKMIFYSIEEFIDIGISPNNLFYHLINYGLTQPNLENLVHLLISIIQEQPEMIQKLTIHAWLSPNPETKEVLFRMLELICHENPLGLRLASLLFTHCTVLFTKDVFIDLVSYLTKITENGHILDEGKTELLMWLQNKIKTNTKATPSKTIKSEVINVPSIGSFFNQSSTRPRRELPTTPHEDSVSAAARCDEDSLKPH